MSFLKALIKMKREQQKQSFQSCIVRRNEHTIMHAQTNHRPFSEGNTLCTGKFSSTPSSSSSSRNKQLQSINVPIAKPQILHGFPKQFILAPPETPPSSDCDSHDEEMGFNDMDVYNPSMGKYLSTCHHMTHGQRQQQLMDRFDKEYFTFSDMDYEIPPEVREILKEEGLDNSAVESWLYESELCHRRALAMRRFEAAKYL